MWQRFVTNNKYIVFEFQDYELSVLFLGRIVSLRWEICAHKTSLTLQIFYLGAWSKPGELVIMCARGINVASMSIGFL